MNSFSYSARATKDKFWGEVDIVDRVDGVDGGTRTGTGGSEQEWSEVCPHPEDSPRAEGSRLTHAPPAQRARRSDYSIYLYLLCS